MKKTLTEARFQFLAGVINENEFKQLNEIEDITSKLEAAGLDFSDGILGGVGSGGGGYYDPTSDKISGFKLDKFDENEFNTWYDGFDKDSFNSSTYDAESFNDYEIDSNAISNIKPGVYSMSELEGCAEINSNGDVILYANPTLSDKEGNESISIFTLNSDGSVKPEMSKEEVKNKLQQNTQNPSSWAII
jgi:hypothetical protein